MKKIRKKNLLKRSIRDIVFRDLFSVPENVLELYNELHPEDKRKSIEDLEIITTETVLMNSPYNDLCFIIDHRIIFIEAQTNLRSQDFGRFAWYLFDTLANYFKENEISYDLWTNEILPNVEFYIINCGFSNENGEIESKRFDCNTINLNFLCISSARKGSILDQYLMFCRAVKENIDFNNRTKEITNSFIDYCINQGILKDYFLKKKSEVPEMILKGAGMSQERHLRAIELGLEEKYKRKYEEALNKKIEEILREKRKEIIKGKKEGKIEGRIEGRREGRKEGKEEGRREGLIEGIKDLVRLLTQTGKRQEEMLLYLKENYPVLTEEDIEKLIQN